MATNVAGDRDLSARDVQSLADANAVAAFFATLGYDTSERLPQSTAAMGITAESLRRKVRRIERLANQEQGALQVYLVELDSVTIAATRDLARVLRDRAGNYLLVLTADYEALDFVLLEREAPAAPKSALVVPRVSVHPRALTVERRNPDKVQLRVLRRLTYTEADADAQYDKLLSAYTVAHWSEPNFNNRALFADYFLSERLPEMPEWTEDPRPCYLRLRELYANVRERWSGADESTVRSSLIGPVLEALGFVRAPAEGGLTAPDEILSAGGDQQVTVAALAYTWHRYLDGKDETRDTHRKDENPGARVVAVLEAGTAPWSIVTNGKLWRLYAAAAHSRATSYYEIDLEETLASPDPNEAFRYFWLLFRAAAFRPRTVPIGGEQRELSFLDQVLQESADYARRLGDRLKDRVFEDVFPELAKGFIAHIRHVDGPAADLSQERLDEVFRGTLTLLYRILFLLYAEARDLLPAREVRGYRDKSLSRLKAELAQAGGPIEDTAPKRLRQAFSADPARTELYDRLVELARIVDRGDASVNTPGYNGGLFLTDVAPDDPALEARAARFLARYKVPDRFLALALDRLARDVDEKRGDLAPIDYKSLGVRQLGSIYEGLLEFRLRVAPEKMAIVKGKKTEEIVPYREAVAQPRTILRDGRGRDAPERTLPVGAPYLENDRRERKASGSYYTPDHIVEYIVEHAVGPPLQEHLDRLRPRLREAQQAYRQAQQRQAGFQKKGMAGDDPEKIWSDPTLPWPRLVDELFEFRVLDPAMGSGHFLVQAVDFVTDKLLDFLNGFPQNPVQAHLRRTRETILAEMDRQGVTIDAGKLTDVNLLKRHVLKRCIYGVDLNPMAVELAKVSLWLDCFTLGAPLSFLDHHLKVGNALIGTTVRAVEDELAAARRGHAGDLFGGPLQGLLSATALIEELARMPDATIEQAHQSHGLFADFQREQAPYIAALDIWVSRYFGNKLAQEYLTLVGQDYVAEIRSDGKSLSPQYRAVIANAAELSRTRRFFHWDLEFPEAFIDLGRKVWKPEAQQGFDAVIGNPPWVRQESLGEQKAALQALLPDVYDSVADTYVYFVGRGLNVLHQDGRLGMILPNKWLRAGYGRPLRAFLTEANHPLELIDFGHAPIFPDADTFPCILIGAAGLSVASPLQYCAVPRRALGDLQLGTYVRQGGFDVPMALLRAEGWTPEPPELALLLDKIRGQHPTLADVAPSSLYRGIIPGLTEAFFVDQQTRDRLVTEDPACEPLLRKVLRGRNVERWHPDWDGEWLILLKSSENHPWPWADAGANAEQVFSRSYPSLHRHMKPLQNALEKRQDRGRHWWELRSCSYYERFSKPKILYQDIGFHSWFCFDANGLYCNNTCYFLPTDDCWLLAVLNSSVMWWYLARTATHGKDEAFRLHSHFMLQLPMPEPSQAVRQQLEESTVRMIQNAAERQACRRRFYAELSANLGVEHPSRKLEQFWRLDGEALEAELQRASRRPFARVGTRLDGDYARFIDEYQYLLADSLRLECQLQRIVFDLYGLTPEEVHLLRGSAPPRDPLALVEEEARMIRLDLREAP